VRRSAVALIAPVFLGVGLVVALTPAATGRETIQSGSVLLINQISSSFPEASVVRGQQVLMLLRHFVPKAEIVSDRDFHPGLAERFDRVVVVGNDAVDSIRSSVLAEVRRKARPTLWVGYGLGAVFSDPDRAVGFAPGFVDDASTALAVTYRGRSYQTALDEYHRVRIGDPGVEVLASLTWGADAVPLAVRNGNFWFFAGLPGFDTPYPDPGSDAPNLIFADILHDFFGRVEHDAPQAIVRLEDVSAHIPPERIIEAVDALAERRIPFVIAVIPAQRLADGTVLSLRDRPQFVQALRYAQDRGGTIALHGYHHTFGQGEDYEFWDAVRGMPLDGERREAYSFKVEDGIRSLRDEGLEPLLWETPHYAASPLAYQVFGDYFSHAIENRDPATWLPYVAGPDPAGQTLIPENLGYINESEGWTVDDQLARADALRIVRDATAVGFYHPASIPVPDLERLVDGLSGQGYRFADVRSLPLRVDFAYRPDAIAVAAAWARTEPGLTVLELEHALLKALPAIADVGSPVTFSALGGLAIGFFLIRLRAQWRPNERAHRTHLETETAGHGLRIAARVALASAVAVAAAVSARQTFLAPIAPSEVARVETPPAAKVQPRAIESGGWELSVYFTAVEKYYSGPLVKLIGCPVIDCSNGTTDLGAYPGDFLAAVKEEGSGRLTASTADPRYLNWSISVGYWLDSAPRDARGSILDPYVSAAADPGIQYVSTFRIETCGDDARTREPLTPVACESISRPNWIVRDRFTAGAVGKHLDLYIGEQDSADFLAASTRAIHALNATISLQPYLQAP
jgi:hypothetical protein